MSTFTKRRKVRRILYSKVSLGILCLLTIVMGRAVYGAYDKKNISEEAEQKATREYDELRERKEMLEANLHNLETPIGQEAELRRKFPVAKEGEHMLILVEE